MDTNSFLYATKIALRKASVLIFILLATPALCNASNYDFIVDGLCYKIDSNNNEKVIVVPSNGSISSTINVLEGNYAWLTKIEIPETVTYNGVTYHVKGVFYDAFRHTKGITSFSATNLDYVQCPSCLTATIVSDNECSRVECSQVGCLNWNIRDCTNPYLGRVGYLNMGEKVTKIPYTFFEDNMYHSLNSGHENAPLVIPENLTYMYLTTFGALKNSVVIFKDASKLSFEPKHISTDPPKEDDPYINYFFSNKLQSVYYLRGEMVSFPVYYYPYRTLNITLGRDVDRIFKAFEYYDSISYHCYALTPPTLSYDILNNRNLGTVYIPKAATGAYFANEGWVQNTLINTLILPDQVSISPESADIEIGQSFDVTAEVTPQVDSELLVWSTNPKIVSYSNGKATALAAGEADLIAFCVDRFDTCHVVVQQPQLLVNKDTIHLKYDPEASELETDTIIATTLPAAAMALTVYCPVDYDVVTADDNGVVTVVGPGETDIYIKCCDQVKKCHVIVDEVPIEPVYNYIILDKEQLTMEVNDFALIDISSTEPVDDYTVTNEDQGVAYARKVNNQIYVSALKAGTTTITVGSTDGEAIEAQCVVTVRGTGDVNGDGTVNAGDISELYQAILEGSSDSRYDINGDGNVNAGDISELYNSIVNAAAVAKRLF